MQKLGFKKLYTSKKCKQFKLEWLVYAYAGAFLPEEHVIDFCAAQEKYLVRSVPKTERKIQKIKEYIRYQKENYTDRNSRFAKSMSNLWKRAHELDWTNNISERENKIWHTLVGKRANYVAVMSALAHLDAIATVDYEALIAKYGTEEYVTLFNKKSAQRTRLDEDILENIDAFKQTLASGYSFEAAKAYLIQYIRLTRPYMDNVHSMVDTMDESCEQKSGIAYDNAMGMPEIDETIQIPHCPAPTAVANSIFSEAKARKINDKYQITVATDATLLKAMDNFVYEYEIPLPMLVGKVINSDAYKQTIAKYSFQTSRKTLWQESKRNGLFVHGTLYSHPLYYLPNNAFLAFKVRRQWHLVYTVLVEDDSMLLLFIHQGNGPDSKILRPVNFEKTPDIDKRVRVL